MNIYDVATVFMVIGLVVERLWQERKTRAQAEEARRERDESIRRIRSACWILGVDHEEARIVLQAVDNHLSLGLPISTNQIRHDLTRLARQRRAAVMRATHAGQPVEGSSA